MNVAQSFAQLAQMHVAHQSRFYRDNAKLDTLLMQWWPELAAAEDEPQEAVPREHQEGNADGIHQSDR